MRALRIGLDAALTALVLTVVALILLLRGVPFLTGWHAVTIMGPSMGEALPMGSLAYADPDGQLDVGSIVTYQTAAIPLTHRVIEIRADIFGIQTQGDANEHPDANPVPREAIVGTVSTYAPPPVGWAAYLVSQPIGIGLIVSLGLLLVVMRSLLPMTTRPAENDDDILAFPRAST